MAASAEICCSSMVLDCWWNMTLHLLPFESLEELAVDLQRPSQSLPFKAGPESLPPSLRARSHKPYFISFSAGAAYLVENKR